MFMQKPRENNDIFYVNSGAIDKSFSCSMSIEIFMRQIYVQNFSLIGLVFQELLCKRPLGRPDTLTIVRGFLFYLYFHSVLNKKK